MRFQKAVHGEACTCEERQGETEFADDEQATHLIALCAEGGASAVFQRLLRIDAPSIPGGGAAEEQPGESCCGESSGENRQVELEVGFRRHDAFGNHSDDTKEEVVEGDAECSAQPREEEASVRN